MAIVNSNLNTFYSSLEKIDVDLSMKNAILIINTL